jgi:hypothetical protein
LDNRAAVADFSLRQGPSKHRPGAVRDRGDRREQLIAVERLAQTVAQLELVDQLEEVRAVHGEISSTGIFSSPPLHIRNCPIISGPLIRGISTSSTMASGSVGDDRRKVTEIRVRDFSMEISRGKWCGEVSEAWFLLGFMVLRFRPERQRTGRTDATREQKSDYSLEENNSLQLKKGAFHRPLA